MSRHGATQSHVVGPAIAAGGGRTTAYQACVALMCSACGQAIPPDEVFSRRSRKVAPYATGQLQKVAPYATGQLQTVPVCTTCRPLRLGERDNTLPEGATDGHL